MLRVFGNEGALLRKRSSDRMMEMIRIRSTF
jgi:hypothetical protein